MKKFEKELKDAILSGDMNRIALAKERLHQRKMKLATTPIQNLADGTSSVLSPEDIKANRLAKTQQVAGVVSTGANLASELIDPNNADGTMNIGRSMGKSALQMGGTGAATGAMFGPVGAGVGAAIGTGIGLIVGNKQAKKQNQIIQGIKTKAFAKNLSLAANNEENSFNMNAPQYLAKGGEVKKPQPFKTSRELTKEEEIAQAELRKDQELLSKAFDEKYSKLMGVNVKNILTDYTRKKDYDRRNLDAYGKELTTKYQDLALTADEMKTILGEEKFAKYINNKKLYNQTPWMKEVNATTKGSNEDTVDPTQERFGWRNLVERYRWGVDPKEVSPYLYLQNSLPKDEKGGFVLGQGSETSDSNQKKVEVGSQVIPSAKNAPKAVKEIVLNIAKGSGTDTELKGKTDGPTKAKVNLSKGELVIPPEKVAQAESVANAQGTTLNEVRDTINVMNTKGKPNKSGINLAKGTPSVQKEKITKDGVEYFKPLEELNPIKLKGFSKNVIVDPQLKDVQRYGRINGYQGKSPKSKFSIAPEVATGILQTAAGVIGKSRNEAKINQSLGTQKAIAEQTTTDAMTAAKNSLDAKKASINTMFKDTQNTADKLKTQSLKDLATNSLTTQEFTGNYNKVAGSVLDSVAKANNDKTSMLLDAESQGQANIQGVIERGGAAQLGIEGKQNAFNIAKATQSASLEKAGMDNLIGYMQNIKDEKVRKEKMQGIIDMARQRNISIQDAATIMLGDLKNGVSSNIKLF